MSTQFVLSEYIDQAQAQAEYDKLEDGTFSGWIAACPGVIAFGSTLRECKDELHSTLEEWVRLGLRLDHELPVVEEVAELVFEQRKSDYPEELAKGQNGGRYGSND